jgi:hypothetical protein
MRVRTGGFEAGVAIDTDGAITTDIIEEYRRLHGGVANWIRFRDVMLRRNWAKKYGSSRVTRARDALVAAEILVAETEGGGGSEDGRYIRERPTGRYRLCDGCLRGGSDAE